MEEWKSLGFLVFLGLYLNLSCSPSQEALQISGSTSAGHIMELLIEDFLKKSPQYTISYEALGSSIGIQNVIEGIYPIGLSSRELSQRELDKNLLVKVLAKDAIFFVTHPSVPVDNLSLAQVQDIFTGQTLNWATIVPKLDKDIVLFVRDEASGTQKIIIHFILQGRLPQRKDAVVVTSSGDLLMKVESTPYSLGYVDLSHRKNIQNSTVVSLNGIDPSKKNIIDETYLLSREIFLVYTTRSLENPLVLEFLDYLYNDTDVRPLMETVGLLPPKTRTLNP